ncbi:Nn.00g031340.m01.CDS01 [Neocucurbitaria sp. VM-36]
MHIFIILVALLSALINALPAISNGDGRGATIWTLRGFQGSSVAIPANNWCTDMNNVFGNFDGNARSLTVASSYKCQFYTEYGCPSKGKKLDYGRSDRDVALAYLPADFDRKIHSAYCSKINGKSASSTEIDDTDVSQPPTLTERADTRATWNTACILSDGQDLRGSRSIDIPSNEQCFELEERNEEFDWETKVRSFTVYAYNRCHFYTENGCPENGKKLEAGNKQEHEQTFMMILPSEFDRKIRSVHCEMLG